MAAAPVDESVINALAKMVDDRLATEFEKRDKMILNLTIIFTYSTAQKTTAELGFAVGTHLTLPILTGVIQESFCRAIRGTMKFSTGKHPTEKHFARVMSSLDRLVEGLCRDDGNSIVI